MSAEQPVASTSATHAESTLRNGDEKAQQEGKPSKSKMRGRREDTPDVRASKTLSYILRHGASKEGLKMRKDGFVRVDELLKRPKLKEVDLDMLKRLVEDNDKKRYALAEESDPQTGEPVLWIRANQGHSVEVEDLKLEKITRAEDCPVVVHGTFTRHWDSIRRPFCGQQGLKVMNRHHIHCAPGLFGEEGVTSGMRASCDLYIYIDVAKAMQEGIEFERSANGVILTKGKAGVLAPDYFKLVKNKKGDVLWPESQAVPNAS